MPKLKSVLNSWGTAAFPQSLKDEMSKMETGVLPLHNAISCSELTIKIQAAA